MKTIRAAVAASVVMLGLGSVAQAQDVDDETMATAMDFAMHDAKFTMYHEIGHMLVAELGLPVLGKEEDAVDTLATIWLLTDESDDDSYNALIDASDGWYFNAVKSTGSGVDEFSYYDEHSLDIQRAYAMVCLMVGKDPDTFAETADNYGLDPDQQESCGYTIEQAETSWNALLEPHLVGDGAESAPIEVLYDDSGDYTYIEDALKDRGILEHAAELVMSRYALPNPVTFRASQCGEANAFFDPSTSTVTYCYELAEDLMNLYINDIAPAYSEGEE